MKQDDQTPETQAPTDADHVPGSSDGEGSDDDDVD
jgi:hypothetical protein